jgi:hypothetical protein
MLRVKAVFFLFLFFYSTVGTFASVHSCDGKITDLSIISLADCSHSDEAETKKKCCHKCCSSKEKEKEEDDCCETDQLVDSDDLHFSPVSVEIFSSLGFIPFTREFCELNEIVVDQETAIIFDLPPPIHEDIPILLHRLII